MRSPLDLLVPPVPPTRADLSELDAALEDAFAPDGDGSDTQLCGYCGLPTDGKWCSVQCREADADDGQHRGEE